MEKTSITPAEWKVMRVVWSQTALTSREIIETLHSILDWKEGTIKSLINRLIQKGYLEQNTSQKPLLYQATISSQQALQNDLSDLMTRSCVKDRGLYIAYLIESETLSIEDCQHLMSLLDAKTKTAPESIPCTCPKGQCTCLHH